MHQNIDRVPTENPEQFSPRCFSAVTKPRPRTQDNEPLTWSQEKASAARGRCPPSRLSSPIPGQDCSAALARRRRLRERSRFSASTAASLSADRSARITVVLIEIEAWNLYFEVCRFELELDLELELILELSLERGLN